MLFLGKKTLLILVAVIIFANSLYAQILFENVTASAGISTLPSKGFCAAWGDYNNDGWPDLFVNHHQYDASLYMNNRNGTFNEVSEEVLDYQGIDSTKDTHGCLWIDYDNDGDSDLMQVSGGNGGRGIIESNFNEFFINENGLLIDRATQLNLTYSEDRGRSPLFFDYDYDGLLDLFIGNLSYSGNPAPSKLFHQVDGNFEDVTEETGIQLDNDCTYSHISDINADDIMEFIVFGSSHMAVYDYEAIPFMDISYSIYDHPEWINKRDVLIADFNGDLLPDIYKPKGSKGAGLRVIADNEFKFLMQVSPDSLEKYLTFVSGGNIHFNIWSPWLTLSDVYIGSGGYKPSSWEFDLSPADPNVQGIKSYISGQDKGIYVGFNPDTQAWSVILNSSNVLYAASDSLNGIISSDLPMSDVQPHGFVADAGSYTDKFFLGTSTKLLDKSALFGFYEELPSESAVAGDFDNDMDLDIYVVMTTMISNEPNELYENRNGYFVRIPDTGGASGTLQGIGAAVNTADYDGDGFLDLYFVNGQGTEPLALGPDQLFRNLGNSNHWIQIDLQGVDSNRDAIGTKVFATAGGVTQLREQNGGSHFFVQDHTRLHFGLGVHEKVDLLRIEWPGGIVQELRNIPADQIIRIIEPGDAYSIYGQPSYVVGVDEGVFLWKDSFDGRWKLRVVGNSSPESYVLKVVSDSQLLSLTQVGLDAVSGDALETWNYGFKMQCSVLSSEKGLDFALPEGVNALLSVEKNGLANPRQLYVGPYKLRLAPSGWILPSNDLPSLPNYTAGEKMGWYFGSEAGTLKIRWTVNKFKHDQQMTLMSSDNLVSFQPFNLELQSGDNYTLTDNSFIINSVVSTPYYDGADFSVSAGAEIAISYKQDGLFQPQRLNPDTILPFGFPNAYKLPASCMGPVKIKGASSGSFSTLQSAHEVAMEGDTIQSQAGIFIGNINIDRNLTIKLEGGYDCNFSSIIDSTIINGDMLISNGTVIIENFTLE